MNKLILLMIISVTCFPYLISMGWLPPLLNYTPELLSLFVLVYVIVRGVQSRFRLVAPAYWLAFGSIIFVVACGAILNLLAPGVLFAGLRTYLRGIPFFLLPAVYLMSEPLLRQQLMLLLAISIGQLPLAWSQRTATIAGGGISGDETFGTLMGSGMLSLFLICAACVMSGMYIRRQLRLAYFLPFFFVVVLPTTINETKVTFVLLPLALLATFYVGSPVGTRFRNSVLGIVVATAFLAVFVPVYDHFRAGRSGDDIVDFFTTEGQVRDYLIKGAEIGDQQPAGKFDAIFAAFDKVTNEPSWAGFGLGIGNASPSSLGPQYAGAYFRLFAGLPMNSLSYILLELGLLGLAIVFLLHGRIGLDSVNLATGRDSIPTGLAVGWVGVSVVIVVSLAYTTAVSSVALSYLYWYFSGVIAAARRWREFEGTAAETLRRRT